MNTFGLRSVNTETFNIIPDRPEVYPQGARDSLVTLLRIHNLSLNILGYNALGYLPGASNISGCVRMFTGLAIVILTLSVGDPNAQQGAIIGHWFSEALITGIAQIARGALEAMVPNSLMILITLDAVGTLINMTKECRLDLIGQAPGVGPQPYPDVDYASPLQLLHLV